MFKTDVINAISGVSSKGISKKLKCKHADLYENILKLESVYNTKNINEIVYRIINDITDTPICNKCKSVLKFKGLDIGYPELCGKCSMQGNIKKTMLEKYGVENAAHIKDTKTKRENTCLKRYGVKSHNSLQTVKDKKKHTLYINYGDDGLSHNAIKEKRINTCLSKYGVEHHTKLESTQLKKKETCLSKYGVENVMQEKSIKDKMKNSLIDIEQFNEYVSRVCNSRNYTLLSKYESSHKNITISCNKCCHEFNIIWNIFQQGGGICPNCFPLKYGISKAEKDIAEYIKSLGIDIIENNRDIIKPKELDIVIPELNIAIEYCGLWCNSTDGNNCVDNKPESYHLDKLNSCLNNNYRLITIFEDEWVLRNDVVKSCLSQKLKISTKKIFARKCKLKQLRSEVKKDFFESNHLQGDTVSSVNYGLYFDNELVCAMSFKQTNSIGKIWHLERYCCKPFITVIGGPSKLLSHFKKNNEWNKIITYADKRWSEGNVYTQLGFDKINDTQPNYWYWGNDIIGRKHRLNFTKKLLTSSKNFDEKLSEREIMLLDGYNRIYDCGSIRFEMNNISTI